MSIRTSFTLLIAGLVLACGRKDDTMPPPEHSEPAPLEPMQENPPLPDNDEPAADMPSDSQMGPIAQVGTGGSMGGVGAVGGKGPAAGMGGQRPVSP